jgi:hypothetical protein
MCVKLTSRSLCPAVWGSVDVVNTLPIAAAGEVAKGLESSIRHLNRVLFDLSYRNQAVIRCNMYGISS